MRILTKVSAISFLLWGILHFVGGTLIMFSAQQDVVAGFSFYQHEHQEFHLISGAILSYFAWLIAFIGGVVSVVAVRFNWHNSATGLMVNSLIILFVEVGLVIFLVLPGYLPISEAGMGLALFVVGVILGGIACNNNTDASTLSSSANSENSL